MSISSISRAAGIHDAFGRSARSGDASRAEGGRSAGGLTPDERAQVEKLQARDREVRTHEAAHAAAGAGLAGGASFTYQRGPDGVNYAIGGEVRIDASPGRTPEETIAKARQVQAAALAPAQPSGQDRAVAAEAATMEQEARAEAARTDDETAPGRRTPADAYRATEARTGGTLDVFA